MKLIPITLICLLGVAAAQVTILHSMPEANLWAYNDKHRDRDKYDDEDLITKEYDFDLGGVDYLVASFEYALGSLAIESGIGKKITGTIVYDPDEFIPKVSYNTFGSEGLLKAKLKSINSDHDHNTSINWDDDDEDQDFRVDIDWSDLKDGDFHQEYDFELPKNIRIDMKMDFGLGEADIDLTDLDIASLELECGLSDVKINCDEENSIKCKEVYIESGLGDFNAYGLGLIRAKYINLDVGLGSAYVDLSTQNTNLRGDINVGLGSLELVLPEKANIKIRVDDSFLSSVDVDDMVKTGHKEWSTSTWNDRYTVIELDIAIGLGSVDVDLVK